MTLALAEWKIDQLNQKHNGSIYTTHKLDEMPLFGCKQSWSIEHAGQEKGQIGKDLAERWMSHDLEGQDKIHRTRMSAVKYLVAKQY